MSYDTDPVHLPAPIGAAPPDGTAPARTPLRWVPIRSLSERQRPRVVSHLLALDGTDRYFRFGHPASDAQIGHYVDTIDFERDEVFGIFNRRLELIALAHLAYLPDAAGRPPTSEFGVSVLPKARGRGYGARLFDLAVLHARNRGIENMVVHALSENSAMLRIARSAGATIQREGPDARAMLRLPSDDIASRVGAWLESGAAEIDYQVKSQAHQFDQIVDALAEVKALVGKNQRDGVA